LDQQILATEGYMTFDHLGVLVSDLAHGRSILSRALGIRHWTVEFDDPVNDVFVQFGRCASGMCYEAVAPRSPESPVRNALSEAACKRASRLVRTDSPAPYRIFSP